MKTFDFVVYGNNVAAMISAIELAKKYKVALINPIPNWGAHFAGIKINGHDFDIGMNFFEFTTFHKSSDDLMTYNPAARNDSARFCKLVEKYVTSTIDVVEVDKIETLSQGIFAGDIVMANQFDILNKLPQQTILKIRNELEAILANGDKSLHASQKKLKEEVFLKASYCDASIANHGKTFHDLFIEPFCVNIFNISSKNVPALLHRIVWAPLFYPETLLNAITGNAQLATTRFHYPAKAYFAAFVEEILNQIIANKNITIISRTPKQFAKKEKYEFTFEDDKFVADNLIWCNDLQSLLTINSAKVPEYFADKASISLAFCNTESSNVSRLFSCLYICDEKPIYRITNREYAAKNATSATNSLVLEFNHDVLIALGLDNDEKIIDHLNGFLTRNGIIKTPIKTVDITIKTFKNVVNLPTISNLNNFEKLHKLTKHLLPAVELLGPASGFVSNSFNDQIVQALKIGKKYN